MKRYTAKSILGMQLGLSNEDLEEYRYQYGRTNRPVYAIGDEYFCAVKIGQKPAKSYEEEGDWSWEKYESSFAESNGWQIWIARLL